MNIDSTKHSVFRQVFHKLLAPFCFQSQTSLKQSLEEVLDEHNSDGDAIDKEERLMLKNVLTFSELSVEDVMIPRADIVAVEHDINLDCLKEIMVENAHTRLPVYHTTLDDIAGFVHIKDLVSTLCNGKKFSMKSIMRDALFVPPSMKIRALLMKMQLSRVHMALVVDEYGGTSGLVTLEDLMEEIVGEIEDEHDIVDDILFAELEKNKFEASARIDIEDLEKKLDVKFTRKNEHDDFDTLGGLVFSMLGRVPSKGEVALHSSGLEFEVSEVDPRRIKKVVIRRKNSGLTLVEIAVSFIIISLMTIGIVSGSSILRSSSINATISQLRQYQTAISLFEVKYNSLPGDMRNAKEYWPDDSQYSGFATGWGPSSTGIEIANGILNSDYEKVWAWQQLHIAGYITENLNGKETTYIPTIGLNIPAAKVDKSGFTFYYNTSISSATYGREGMTIDLVSPNDTGITGKGGAVTPSEAQSIDKKMDDGFAATGNILGSHGFYDGSWQGCIKGGDLYDINKTNPWCRILFFFSD